LDVRLRDEADLCRAETANDIAALLDEAADEIERLQAALAEACDMLEADAKQLYYSTHGRRLAEKAKEWRALLPPNASLSGASRRGQTMSPSVRLKELLGHLDSRRLTIEASIAAEVLAGNAHKEACERTALAEIAALEDWIRQQPNA
jgi:hypothetical protein